MIDQANSRISHQNIDFQCQKINAPLAFSNNQFDIVCFCSVLFFMTNDSKKKLMKEAIRVLKPNGKVIILTPSGKKSIFSSFMEVWGYKFSIYNFTFPIWKIATTIAARKWQQQKWIEKYAVENKLNYNIELTFNYNASIETISKITNI
jgi:ubiquinone/menaquinone biosynthesis C-methylase UbiE